MAIPAFYDTGQYDFSLYDDTSGTVTAVTVNGITVTDVFLNFEIERSFGFAITDLKGKVTRKINTLTTLNVGSTIRVTRNGILIFDGFVERFEPQGGVIELVCKDKITNLARGEIVYSYDQTVDVQAGKVSEIFRDVVVRFGKLNAGKYGVDSNTVALWHFEETSGANVTDSSENLFTGTATGTTITIGKFLKGRSFNGTTDFVTFSSGAINNLSSGTWEGWFNRSGGLGTAQAIMDKTSGGTTYFKAFLDTDDKFTVIINNSTPVKSVSSFITTGVFNHVAVTWNGANIKIFVNGVLQTNSAQTNVVPNFSTSIFAGKTNLGTQFFNGILDEIRVSNTVRDRLQSFDPIQDSGTTLVLSKFIANHADPLERCKVLAETLDWQFFYRPDKDAVFFEPKGFVLNSTNLQVGTNILGLPKWDIDNTEMANKITIIGAAQLVEFTENFNGTGSQTIFTLLRKPESAKVFISGVLKTGGAPGATGTFDYRIDKENKQIIFTFAPPAGVNNVEINYAYGIPTPVQGVDAASIATFGTYEKTIFLGDVASVADAENRLNNLLLKYANPFFKVPLKVKTPVVLDIQVGRKIRVIDSINNQDKQLVVNKYVLSYPHQWDEVDMGDKIWRTEEWGAKIEEKIHRLEEQNTKTQDLLLHLQSVGVNTKFQRDKIQVFKRGIGFDAIYDNETKTYDSTDALYEPPPTIILGAVTTAERTLPKRLGGSRGAFRLVYERNY